MKKLFILACSFLLFVFGNIFAQPSEIRIVKAIASSVETNHPDLIPDNVIDGNPSTRWSANWTSPQWICFDLGSKQSFNQLNISWEAAYAKKYAIQISDDQKKWDTVFEKADGNGGEDIVAFETKKARFIRILCIERGTTYGYSIFEIHVFQNDGTSSAVDAGLDGLPGNNIKVEKVVVSSIENDRPELRGENAVDGNPVTRWASARSDPQFLIMDLGAEKDVSMISILWEAAFAKKFEILFSKDNKNFAKIYSDENGKGGTTIIAIKSQRTRYIKINCLERGTDWGYSIFEVKIANKVLDDGKIPLPPSGLSVSGGEDVAFLQWDRNKENDLFGYNLYRSSDSDKGFIKLNTKRILGTKFQDTSAKNRTQYYYATAIDFKGNESSPSGKVSITMSGEKKRNFLPVPACVWKHYLGDLPENCISSSPNRGVALGGFGTGSFMYNISGSFGPFQRFDNTLYARKWLPQAAFHFYEKIGKNKPVVKTLAADGQLLSAWDKLKTGDGTYYALQPKGWITYNCFDTDLSQEFFSPILPNNYKETSYPVGVWKFKIHNPSDQEAQVSVMLTFPGVYIGENIDAGSFVNTAVDKAEMTGVVLASLKSAGEWCIAAKKSSGVKITYATSWNGDGDGSDIMEPFKALGSLNNGNIDSSQKAGALAVSATLKPGEEIIIPIVIAWDFPVVKFNSGTEWWKKYTEYFGRTGTSAAKIAEEALSNYPDWEKGLDAWMNPVITSDKYPDWLKCAAFNELYYNQFGGSFYESGLKSGHKEEYLGLHAEDHKHFILESPIYTSANTLDVRHYASLDYALFWPDIERDTLMGYADATLNYQFPKPVPVGLVPHDVGDPKKCDPFFEFDVYRHDIPDLVYWKDLSPKFVQQCWRYYYLYHDKKFLDYVWPCMKAVFSFMKSTDKNGDFLPDNSGSDNTYDAWGLYGTSLLCGGLWVGALESLEQMAIIEKDSSLSDIRDWLGKAKYNLDKQLWIADKGYYKMDTAGKHPDAVMSDGLNGELYCFKYGLADILPRDKMKSHLKTIFDKCVKPLKDYTGDGIGDIGAINAVNYDGSSLGTMQSDEIWTGSTYFLSALMVNAGLEQEALQSAYGVYYNTYVNPETAFWFDTPESWRIGTMITRPSNPEQYQRPRAVWELLLTIDNPYKKQVK